MTSRPCAITAPGRATLDRLRRCVFLDLWHVYQSPNISEGFDTIVADILSMFVVIELLKSIVEYFEVHRIKITFILDAAVVFLLREVMIGLYRHALDGGQLGGIAGLLLAGSSLLVGGPLARIAVRVALRPVLHIY